MAVDYTTTALLASIRRRGALPSTSDMLDDTDLLALATEELQTTLVSLLLSLESEHLVTHEDTTVTVGTAAYEVPSRAVGGTVRDVALADGTTYPSLSYIEPEREYDGVSGYKFENTSVVLVPTPTESGTLRVKYHRRPSNLVAASAVGTITAINTGTRTVTVSGTVPSTMNTDVPVDLVKGTPGFRSLEDDKLIDTVTSNTIHFYDALPADLEIGDYVCLAGESPVPQVPKELHPYLAAQTRWLALDAIGDPRAPQAEAAADRAKNKALALLTPRGKGAGRVIINKYGPGFRATVRFRTG